MFIAIANAIGSNRRSSKIQKLINTFKARVLADGGTFEAESCLKTTLESLNLQYPPLLITAPVVSGNNYSGQTLTTTNGVFDGITPLVYTYQWLLDGNPILGATSSTYVVTSNGTISCKVTATNSFGSVTSTSNSIEPTPLLLDTYGSAAAAYSLRKLRTDYTGSAIRVRRASDNTETNIGFVNNELDITTLQTFCSGTNGFVTTWYDQSGNAKDATQTTLLNQPKIVSSGSLILENGKPSLQFDGSNDVLQNTLINLTQPNTYFSVFKGNTNLGEKQRILDGITSRNAIFNGGVGRYTLFAGASGISTYSSNTNQNLLYALFNGANSEININSGTPSIIDPGTSALYGLTIGRSIPANNTHDGTIQEVIVYNSLQSSNRTGIETNINEFYSIY